MTATTSVGSFKLVVEQLQGRLTLEEPELAPRALELRADLRSVSCDSRRVQEAAKGPMLLDVERFPEARFVLSGARALPDNHGYEINGDLTLHGVTRSIGFSVVVASSGDLACARARFALDRHDFALDLPALLELMVSDEVVVEAKLCIRRDDPGLESFKDRRRDR